MTIRNASFGTASVGTTQITPAFPATVTADQMFVIGIVNKYPPNVPTNPSGWTLVGQESAGSGPSGDDTGEVVSSAYVKTAVGDESGTITINITSGNSALGRVFSFSKESENSWASPISVEGTLTSAGTAVVVRADTAMNLRLGDFVVVVASFNSDAYSFSGQSISMSGLTFDAATERNDTGTTQGQDIRLIVTSHRVASGDTTGKPYWSGTASGSSANAPAGALIFIRLREVGPSAEKRIRRNIVMRGAKPEMKKKESKYTDSLEAELRKNLLR